MLATNQADAQSWKLFKAEIANNMKLLKQQQNNKLQNKIVNKDVLKKMLLYKNNNKCDYRQL